MSGYLGAVWLDADHDGRRQSARDYARDLVRDVKLDAQLLLNRLADYDRAIAVQSAHLLQESGVSLLGSEVQQMLSEADNHVQAGFRDYLDAWRVNQQARSGR
jgi:hypothetical protein